MPEPLQTPFSRSLGLKYPIFIAPMFLVSNGDMLAAAAEAGVIAAMPHLNARTHGEFRSVLAEVRRRTDGPIAVNLIVNFPGSPERLEPDLEACVEYGVNVVVTSMGLSERVVRRAHEAGMKVVHDVVGVKHARKAAAAGVDALVAVCAGAGGHGGTVSPFVLGPWLRKETGLPVLLSGCISNGTQMAAALALGADMAYMGTRFIACEESGVKRDYLDMLLRAGPEDVVWTPDVCGVHANFLKESYEAWRRARDAGDAELPKPWKDVWGAGQGVGFIDEVKPLARIVEETVEEYRRAVSLADGGGF